SLRPRPCFRLFPYTTLFRSFGEEILEKLGRLVREEPRLDDDPVIQPVAPRDIEHGAARARFRVGRRVHEPRDPRMDERARAHRAWLERHVERRAWQAVVADAL